MCTENSFSIRDFVDKFDLISIVIFFIKYNPDQENNVWIYGYLRQFKLI